MVGTALVNNLKNIRDGKNGTRPEIIIDEITKMFPTQRKIELFARKNFAGWDNWGLEIPEKKVEIFSQSETEPSEPINEEMQQLNFHF